MKTKDIALATIFVLISLGLLLLLIFLDLSEDSVPKEIINAAENSDCVLEGKLTKDYVYNPDTKTWWIDLDVKGKENCNPVCVIYEETLQANINWRCTGLNLPKPPPVPGSVG